MSNNFKPILYLYFLSSCFCLASGLDPLEETTPFQTISFAKFSGSPRSTRSISLKQDGLNEPGNQRSALLRNDAIFLADVLNGLGLLGLKKDFLIAWKNPAECLNYCVVKVAPSAFFLNHSHEPPSCKLNLMLADFSSTQDDASDENVSFFIDNFLKSDPALRISANEFNNPEASEDLSFHVFERQSDIVLLKSEVMREIIHLASRDPFCGFYLLLCLALDAQSALRFWAVPAFSMIIEAEDETLVVRNEMKKLILDINTDISHSKNEPVDDLEHHQSPEVSFVIANSMAPEKKTAFSSNPAIFLTSHQGAAEISKMRNVTPKKNASSPLMFQTSSAEETTHPEGLFVMEELVKQENKREKPLFSLLHQQHQGWSGKTQEHSGGKKTPDPLDAFLNLFKGFFETVWGRLIVKIG